MAIIATVWGTLNLPCMHSDSPVQDLHYELPSQREVIHGAAPDLTRNNPAASPKNLIPGFVSNHQTLADAQRQMDHEMEYLVVGLV